MALSKERRGEIAYLVLKHQKQSGQEDTDSPLFVIKIVNVCEAVGISRDEALQFVEEILKDDLRELFAKFDGLRARDGLV